MINWKIFNILNKIAKFRLERILPGIVEELENYSSKSDTTGTKWTSLLLAVKSILKYKPLKILESGTGASTIVLARALIKIKKNTPDYHPKIISMESVEKWYKIAKLSLPDKYNEIVEIKLGPREKYENLFFRGYVHSNIPIDDYSFVFLDGPNYDDEYGSSYCADIIRVIEISNFEIIRGVIDTRVSSVYVLQSIFGTKSIKYFPFLRTSFFVTKSKKINLKLSSEDFSSTPFGKISLKKFI